MTGVQTCALPIYTWFSRFILFFSKYLARVFDLQGIDGIVNGVAEFFIRLAGILRVTATGLVRNYAGTMLVGGVVIIGYYLFACLMSL